MATSSRRRIIPNLRAATLADIKTLCCLIGRYFEFDHIPFDENAIRAGLETLLRSKSAGQAFLITTDTAPIGYTILTYGFDLEFGGYVGLMTDLYLDPPYRGLGIGKKTLEFLERFCRAKGIKALELQVGRTNQAAQAFYRRLGFHAHDRIPMSKRFRTHRSSRTAKRR